MLTLEDSIEIAAPPERVIDWLMHIDEHYAEWHPDHVQWVNLDGELDEGRTFYYEEYLHGRLYKSRCRITRVERDDGAVIEFEGLSVLDRILGVRGSFVVVPSGDGCVATAVIQLRFERLAPLLAGGIIADLQQHMEEEGLALRRLLE